MPSFCISVSVYAAGADQDWPAETKGRARSSARSLAERREVLDVHRAESIGSAGSIREVIVYLHERRVR